MRSIRTRLRAQTYTSVWNLVCTRHRHAGWLNELTNYEKEGIPDGKAAVDSNHGWDLVRGLSLVALSVCVCVCVRHEAQTGEKEKGAPIGGSSLVGRSLLPRRSRSFTPSGRM